MVPIKSLSKQNLVLYFLKIKINSIAGSIKVIFGFMQNGNCEKDKYLYDCNTELKGIAVNRL